MSGSHGSLAAIVRATFKLAPLPAASSTLVATFSHPKGLATAVTAIADSQLEPAAFEVAMSSTRERFSGPTLCLKFESTAVALGSYVQAASVLMEGARCDVVTSQSESK